MLVALGEQTSLDELSLRSTEIVAVDHLMFSLKVTSHMRGLTSNHEGSSKGLLLLNSNNKPAEEHANVTSAGFSAKIRISK